MDGDVSMNKDENGHEEINEEHLDVTKYMFRPTKNAEVSKQNTSNKEFIHGEYYNPFDIKSDTNKYPGNEKSLISRIYPFADNRPICECDIVQKMTANPDVRYLLSLLPDMAEMNVEQKSVFKTRVITLLHRTLLVES